jgi:hypothetical protein
LQNYEIKKKKFFSLLSFSILAQKPTIGRCPSLPGLAQPACSPSSFPQAARAFFLGRPSSSRGRSVPFLSHSGR